MKKIRFDSKKHELQIDDEEEFKTLNAQELLRENTEKINSNQHFLETKQLPHLQTETHSTVTEKKDKKISGLLIKVSIGIGILGILTALTLPNLLPCQGNAEESEGKNAVGTINRSQQAYHFERAEFGSNFEEIGVNIQTDYYKVSIDNTSRVAYALATPTNPKKQRAYSGAITVDEEGVNFQQIICQANEVTKKPMSIKPIFNGSSLTCPENMTEIR